MHKIKVGFIGLGLVSQVCHLPAFSENKKVKVIAICDVNKSLLNQVSKKYRYAQAFSCYKKMIEKTNLDAIVLSSNRFQTVKIASYILKKKINLLSEKPQAINYKSAFELLRLANKSSSKYHIGYMKRFDNSVLYLKKKIIDISKYGKLKNVYIENFTGDSYGNPFEYIKQKQKKFKQSIFLKYLNSFCHNINLIRFLIGEITDQNVLSETIKFEGEGIVNFKVKKINVILNTRFTKAKVWHEKYYFNYEKAKIELKMPIPLRKNISGQIKIYEHKTGNIFRPFIKHGWSFRNQANYFVSILEKKKDKYKTSAKNSLNDIKIIEKIFK